MQCLVVNVTRAGEWWAQRTDRTTIPQQQRPSYLHETRGSAEREAARLAGEVGGEFAVFELVGIVSGNTLSDTDRVKGVGPCGARIPQWAPEGVGI